MEENITAEAEATLFAAAAVESGERNKGKSKACSNCGQSGHKAFYGPTWLCPQGPREDARFKKYDEWVAQWEANQQAKRDAAAEALSGGKRKRGKDTNSESDRKDDVAEVGNDDMEVEAAADQPELHGAMI